ncbi:Dystrotelin [Collichthys lucidus]|uniref:Dystrotelin n=1 Tax=Collichthys lucidus TaxID=240159 RepID=A0A4U5TYW7_COLLU|nr:Dystrotelin [Collichthys lucidus]
MRVVDERRFYVVVFISVQKKKSVSVTSSNDLETKRAQINKQSKGLNEVRPSVYRVSMKLQCLQRLCHMDGVCVQHITASLCSVGGANPLQEVRLNRQEVMQCLNRMFHSVSQEVQGHVTVEASEDTCDLMFRLYNRCESLSADSLQTALIALTAEPLLTKYRVNSSGSVSRSGLRFLLRDLSQVPAAVQEDGVFGDVEAAVKSCFNGPTWRESLSSLVHSARHALLPRRYTRREADRRRVVMWAEPGETQDSAPPPSDSSTRLAAAGVSHSPSSDRDVSHNAPVQPPLCSKALQTDEDTPPQQVKASAVMSEVRNLQRDKWLLEQQVTAWRLTVQSEQGILEDRCSEMEEEDDVLLKDEWSEEELPTPSPTMHQDTPPSRDIYCEDEEIAGDRFLCCPIGQQDGLEEAGRQEEDTCLSEEENCGMCSPEEVLQETVERLKTVMEADRWRERHTVGGICRAAGERKRAELLEAADQVGDSIHHLVDAVRTNSDDQVTQSQVIKVYSKKRD